MSSKVLTFIDLMRSNWARGARVFCYHTVIERWIDKRVQWPIAVSVEALEQHVQIIKSRYQIVSLDELMRAFDSGEDLRNLAAITFDDGYLSNYRIVWPLLRSYGIPFAIFICTGFVGQHRRLPGFIARCAAYRGRGRSLRVPSLGAVYLTRSDLEREQVASSLSAALRRLPPRALLNVCDELVAAMGFDVWEECLSIFDSDKPLEWDQLAEMARCGVCIGVHTHNHVMTRACRDEADIRLEIIEPREVLRRHGFEASYFAYPSGKRADIGKDAVKAVARAGYSHAFTTFFGQINRYCQKYLLPQLPGQIESVEDFVKMLDKDLFRIVCESALRRFTW